MPLRPLKGQLIKAENALSGVEGVYSEISSEVAKWGNRNDFYFRHFIFPHHRCVTPLYYIPLRIIYQTCIKYHTEYLFNPLKHKFTLKYYSPQSPPSGGFRGRKLSMNELNRKSVNEFRQADKTTVIAVLENIRSAYNVGSVFRTADAFLLEAIYITGYTCTPPHKEIKKTALGAEETVTWKHFANAPEAIAILKANGYKIYAVEQAMNSQQLQLVNFKSNEKIAVIFGNEVTGVEQETIRQCDGCIEIPQLGMKHSLNIATAAGVVLWEIARSRIPQVP
jgi:23S rRNA (guanosine2251-2'-O)-methyltransferase